MVIWGRDVRWREQVSDATLSRWPDDIVIVSIEREWEVPTERKILVSERLLGSDLIQAGRGHHHRHVIQIDHPDFDLEVNLAAMMISSNSSFIEKPIETLQQVLKQAQACRFSFSQMSEKRPTMEGLEGYLRGMGLSDTVITSSVAIADEMFTNALLGSKSKEPSELFIISDGNRLLVGCGDPNGGLETGTLLDRLTVCYEKGAANVINLSGNRAGLGCYLIMEQSVSFFVSVQAGIKTVVLAALPIKGYLKRLQTSHKNLHVLNINQQKKAI